MTLFSTTTSKNSPLLTTVAMTKDWETLDLKLLPNLRELQVGDDCCEAVVRLLLHGKSLERVVIGENSFTEQKYDYPEAIRPACEFVLQDCERLKELKIGRFSSLTSPGAA